MRNSERKKVSALRLFSADTATKMNLPLAEGGISAGFPSPAQEYIDLSLDLNKELISNPSSTFFGRVRGESMKDAGILDGDLLVIDKSLEPQDGDTAVCYIDGEFTLKYIKIKKDAVYLIPANPAFQPIKVTKEDNFCIWGIVTYSIKNHRHHR